MYLLQCGWYDCFLWSYKQKHCRWMTGKDLKCWFENPELCCNTSGSVWILKKVPVNLTSCNKNDSGMLLEWLPSPFAFGCFSGWLLFSLARAIKLYTMQSVLGVWFPTNSVNTRWHFACIFSPLSDKKRWLLTHKYQTWTLILIN